MGALHYVVETQFGNAIQVKYHGHEVQVIVMDEKNFHRFRLGSNFDHLGGQFNRSPVSISLPSAGKWHVVVNLDEPSHVEPGVTVI